MKAVTAAFTRRIAPPNCLNKKLRELIQVDVGCPRILWQPVVNLAPWGLQAQTPLLALLILDFWAWLMILRRSASGAGNGP